MAFKYVNFMLILILALLLLGFGSSAVAGKVVYKWADDQGVIHYTATPPLLRGSKQINRDGLVVGETSAPTTPEERQQQKMRQRLDKEKSSKKTKENKLGRLLLATYRSEADIKSRLLEVLDNLGGEIELATRGYDAESERLRNQVKRAANLQRRHMVVKEPMRKEIDQQRAIVLEKKSHIVSLQNEMASERTKFAQDLARYRDISNTVNSS